jgi:DNA-binding MarR family transcriptional regulator
MADVHTTMLRLVREDTDLTSRQLVVLMECKAGPRTVRGMAEVMRVPKPAVTRAIDRVEGLGLVERKDDPDDRRSVLVQLTAKGKRFVSVMID